MKYHSAIKTKESMKITGKWMGFENITLSEIMQTQKHRHGVYPIRSKYFFSHIVQNNHAKIHRPKEAKN